MPRELTYSQAALEATDQCMAEDGNIILIGEGIKDNGGVFGTTKDLHKKYPERVFESPLSENGVTGFCIGAAISGLRPIMVHQRLDFSLLSLDQIVNNAAKWHYTFGQPVPMVIRMIIGRGWGQGPTHSQTFHNLFATIPGLKVVMPTTAHDAKGLMISAIKDNNPVIFIEHRWLHNIKSEVIEDMYEFNLDECNILRKGEDVTVVGFSYANIEALQAHDLLSTLNVSAEVIDAVSAAPLDIDTIVESVKKTGRLVVADIGHTVGSIGGEVVRQVIERAFKYLKAAPIVVGSKNYPQPTSHYLTQDYYADKYDIVNACLRSVGYPDISKIPREFHDVPDSSFTGPF